MVVDRHRQRALRLLLPDDVVVQDGVDLLRLGQVVEIELGGSGQLLVDDLVAEIDALVADVDAGPAISFDLPLRRRSCRGAVRWCRSVGPWSVLAITRSMMPYSVASSALMKKSRPCA